MAERYIPEHRRTTFKAKNTFKPEELRRRREEQQVEIRKAKREENLAKRRGIGGDGSARLGASLGAEADSDDDTVPTESQVSSSHSFVCNVYSEHTIEFPALCKARRPDPLSPLFTSGSGVVPNERAFRLLLTAINNSSIQPGIEAPAQRRIVQTMLVCNNADILCNNS